MKLSVITKKMMLVPVITLYAVFIIGGILMVGIESFGIIPSIGLTDFSLAGYQRILGAPAFFRNLAFSLYLAFSATVVSTLLGVGLAYGLVTARHRFIKQTALRALEFGLMLPYLLAVFLAMLFLGQTGILSRAAFNIGWLKDYADFPVLIFDPMGLGIIWTFALKGTPFIALFTYRIMDRISGTYRDVAASLQAGEWALFRRIHLPLSASTIVWSSCVVLAYDLGSFEVPYLLNSLKPVPLSSQLYSAYISPDITQGVETMALGIIILTVGLVSVGAYGLVLGRLLKGLPQHGWKEASGED